MVGNHSFRQSFCVGKLVVFSQSVGLWQSAESVGVFFSMSSSAFEKSIRVVPRDGFCASW